MINMCSLAELYFINILYMISKSYSTVTTSNILIKSFTIQVTSVTCIKLSSTAT